MSDSTSGTLHVVATPLGNLGDLSPRARDTLASVALVAAEDTRRTGALLHYLGLDKPCLSVHEHNEAGRIPELLQRLSAGEDLALVSDAGTPLISDPGYQLVRAAREAGYAVLAVPGPSAVTAALSVSGLATDRFYFEGFLPAKASARRRRLQALAQAPHTLVLFESSHRIVDCLEDVVAVLGGQREAFLAREMTKRFEQSIKDRADNVLTWLRADEDRRRGEFVLVLAGVEAQEPSLDAMLATSPEVLLRVLLEELPLKQAVKIAVKATGSPRNEVYALALNLQAEGHGVSNHRP